MKLTSEFIATYWPLTNIKTISLVQQRGQRTVYRVSSGHGDFVFKISDISKNEEAIQRDTDVFDFLENNNFPAPTLLKTKTNKNYTPLGSQFVYALTFIEGHQPEPNVDNYYQLGEITASLHKKVNYPHKTSFTAQSVIPEMIEKNIKYPIGAEYEKLLRNLPDFSKFSQSLIHTDIGLGNSIQRSNGQIILVDWDDAGVGTSILDIGFPLICSFVQNDQFELENATAYYKGYFSNINITQEEKDHIFDAGLFYVLMYSIFDETGIDHINWAKAQFALKNKELILSAI